MICFKNDEEVVAYAMNLVAKESSEKENFPEPTPKK
jgi:hypothetical protein